MTMMHKVRYQENTSWDQSRLKNYGCTEYCQKRGSEDCGFTLQVAKDRGAGGFHNAMAWLYYSNYPTGNDAKAGSVACWKGGKYGHVAYVEDCYQNVDGSWHISVTQASLSKTFFKGEYDVKVGEITTKLGSDYEFQGFMYVPVEDKRVERDTTKRQVKVIANALRVRKEPNGNYTAGIGCAQGIFDVLDIREIEGIQWVKIDEEAWIMINSDAGWSELLEPEESPKAKEILETTKKLNEQIKEIAEENKALSKENAQLVKDNKALQKEVEELQKKIDNAKTHLAKAEESLD